MTREEKEIEEKMKIIRAGPGKELRVCSGKVEISSSKKRELKY
jgi:hypothetical protein